MIVDVNSNASEMCGETYDFRKHGDNSIYRWNKEIGNNK